MADPTEDKDSLMQKLEEDRQKMAVEVSELKEEYNISRWFRACLQKYTWGWVMGAVLTGFLISRLPARKKAVYLWADPVERKRGSKMAVREEKAAHPGRHHSELIDKLWSLAKPILSAYLGRILYQRVMTKKG
jgi:hypothetical protein